jgi:hypothetical protein
MSETKNLKLYKHDKPLESNENKFDIDKALNQNWDKVDEYVEKVNTKIQTLETDNTKNKQDISNIQAEQETQNTTIESLQKENAEIKEENKRLKEDLNAFPTVNESGEYVTLDTADSRFKEFKIFGKSWQEKSSIGKNKLDITRPFLKGKVYGGNGNVIENSRANTYSLKVKDGITYYIFIAQGGSFFTTWKNNEFISYEIKKTGTLSITKDDSFDEVRYSLFTDVEDFETSYINENEKTGYEAFIPDKPSVDFLSEIRNGGDNGNLYDKDNPNVLDTPIDSNGLSGNIKNTYKTVWIKCKSNTTYTVSKKYDATKNRFALAYTSEEPNYSQQVEGYTSNMYASSLTIKTNSTAKYLLAYVWIAGGSVTYQEMLDSIKIEKGTQATLDNGHGLGSMEIIICNKNILNQDLELFQGNYDNNGNVITSSDRRIDKYIFLAKGNYILWSTINNWINILIYDKNKKLLSIKNSNTNKEIAFTLDEDGYIRLGFNPIVESLKVFQLERNNEKTTSEEHKQQIIVFPFKKGQRLMEGDYLAEDGIHHKRKQIVINNNCNIWNVTIQDNGLILANIAVAGITTGYYDKTPLKICNLFKNFYSLGNMQNDNLNTVGCALYSQQIWIRSENIYGITTEDSAETRISKVKSYLEKQNLIAEYELAEEEIEEYTDEQKEAWKQIKNARSYEGQTNIFSTDEISPNFEVTARRNLNAILNSLQAQILAN